MCGTYREICLDRHQPISRKGIFINQCVLPTMKYGCQTWSQANTTVKKLERRQEAMEREVSHAN